MDYKQIMLNLIEFNTMLQGWIDDFQSGELYDEEKSVDWNEGAFSALQKIQNNLVDYGLNFEEDDDALMDDIERLDDLLED